MKTGPVHLQTLPALQSQLFPAPPAPSWRSCVNDLIATGFSNINPWKMVWQMRKWKFTHALYLKSNAAPYFGDLKNTAYSVNSRRPCSIWWDGSRLQDLMIWHFDKIPKISVTTGYMLWFFHQFKHWPSQPGHTSWFYFTFWYISYMMFLSHPSMFTF